MQAFLKGNPTLNALVASALVVSILATTFSLFEPVVSHGQINDTFLINQEIAGEISFLTNPGDVLMDNTISGGITGGNSYGTSTFNITTNDADGYTVTIVFSSTTAMNSTSSPHLHIDNYDPAAGGVLADYTWQAPGAGQHAFGYTVQNATTPTDIDLSFKDNGAATCDNTDDTGTLVGKCWYNKDDATVAEQIIDAAGATVGTGATTSITFQVELGSNSGVETGWYQATATLTANVK